MRKSNCFKHNLPRAPPTSWELQNLPISSSKWCPQQLGAFCIFEFQRGEKLSLSKTGLSAPSLVFLPSLHGEDQALVEVPGCLSVSSLPFGKGSPFPWLQKQTKTIRQLLQQANCARFHQQPLLPATASTAELSEQVESLRKLLCYSNQTAFVYGVKNATHDTIYWAVSPITQTGNIKSGWSVSFPRRGGRDFLLELI